MDEDTRRQMDEAAQEARGELEQYLNEWRARDVAAWWHKWYMKAGHKRLGRVLVDIAKKRGAAAEG